MASISELNVNGTTYEIKDKVAREASDVEYPIPVNKGGTGAKTEAEARTNLGLGIASTKGVDTSFSNVSSTNVPTTAAVASYVGNIETLLAAI